MSQIPDWLGLAIAVIGLFTGGFSGVWAGGVARMRLDRRLRIFDDLVERDAVAATALLHPLDNTRAYGLSDHRGARLLEVLAARHAINESGFTADGDLDLTVLSEMPESEMRAAFIDQDPMTKYRKVGLKLFGESLERSLEKPDLGNFRELLDNSFRIAQEIDSEVRLLPWTDRASWHRVRIDHPAFATEDLNLADTVRVWEARDPYQALADRYDPEAQFSARRAFEKHLERRLRPSLTRRLQSVKYSGSLALKGPWRV